MLKEPNKRIKLLAVTGSLEIGGGQRQLAYLLQLLDRDRFDLVLCLSQRTGALLKEIPDDVPVYGLWGEGARHLHERIWYLRRIVQEEQPDILYSNLLNAGVLCSLTHKTLRRRMGRPRLVLAVVNHPHSYRPLHQRLLKLLYPGADRVVACASEVANYLGQHTRVNPQNISTIYNAVDVEFIRQRAQAPLEHPWLRDGKVPVITCVARMVPQKGYPYLFRAFQRVASELNSRLLVIGDGPEREPMQQLVKDLGIAQQVDLLGTQLNSNNYVAKSDLFVLASLWEGLATVLLEAAAVGTPVISTRVSGVEDVIDDGVNGFVVPVADPEALAQQMLTVLRDDDLRKQFAQRIAQKVEAIFDVKSIVRAYEHLFLNALSSET